jgi:hypothetical protein
MLTRPKKRSWPSCSANSRWKVRRHPPGDRNGKRPSNTSTRAIAAQKVSLSKTYFLAGAGVAPAPDPPPRSALKNSEPAGSSTITSPRLLNVAL